MANFPESGHIDEHYAEPSIMFRDLLPDVDPLRARPGYNTLGQSVDDILRKESADLRQKQLLDEAKKSLVTQFSKQTLASTYWGVGYAAGFTGGGILGALGGYLGMSVATSTLEQMTGTPLTDAVNAMSPEIARFMNEAGVFVANGISSLTDQLPGDLALKTQGYLNNFQSQVVATMTGVKLATFTGNKVGGMWYGPGDRLGESVGTKIATPLVRLYDKFSVRLPSLLNPFKKS